MFKHIDDEQSSLYNCDMMNYPSMIFYVTRKLLQAYQIFF